LFVLPIAVGGKMTFAGTSADADMFVLTVPIFHDQGALALFVFIGGLSAASSMVIVAAIALSTMVCNNIVMPILLRMHWTGGEERRDLSGLLLLIRRASIVVILFLGYGYFRIASESHSLVTIGLVSFSAAAQFAPAIFIGIFWKGASRNGALVGLLLGFLIWVYTLLLPSFAQSGWLPISFIENGPYGIAFLKPYALFGLEGLDRLTHALLWSMFFNIGGFIVISLRSQQGAMERIQGTLFVDVFLHTEEQKESGSRYWSGSATITDLQELVGRFVGDRRAAQAFHRFAQENNIQLNKTTIADSALLDHAETLLAGAIGSATARVMIGSVVKGEIVGLDDVYQILDETSQVIEYSRQLETKSKELEDTTKQLQTANERLKELDELKDDLLSTISHELRTPLTSIRAFSEILSDNPEVLEEERKRFLGVIIKESQRLTRLIDQILDLAKMEAGRMDWSMGKVELVEAVEQALAAMDGLVKEKNVELTLTIPSGVPPVMADRDQLVQVVINLVSNAIKFCKHPGGKVEVSAVIRENDVMVSVSDNGAGILPENQNRIFEKFHQTNQISDQMPRGTGLGLAICREIITFFGGKIWVKTAKEKGACFLFTVPFALPEIKTTAMSAE
ncbi:MAG: ATP-binding protein, partial [Alphaproteobacteria bacterium]|nr:ATP-binding protein [Alphaproteobacteria bacterium]